MTAAGRDRPRVGINADVETETGRVFLRPHYLAAVREGGGVPIVLPPAADPVERERLLASVDALLLTGGDDLDPSWYGGPSLAAVRPVDRTKQEADLGWARIAWDRHLPTLGICYGAQVMSVSRGGSLITDIPTERPGSLPHKPEDGLGEHPLRIEEGTRLASLLGPLQRVNTAHHQSIDRPGEGLRVAAKAPDGIVEGVEALDGRFYLGVQWHPERAPTGAPDRSLFDALVAAGREDGSTAGKESP